jgi:flagellar biosynthesis regulator FlaF
MFTRHETQGIEIMDKMSQATRAYAASAAHRSLREQEADVFRRANAGLREGAGTGPLGRVRALADNGRLWAAVLDLLRDPANPLPEALRANMISVGLTVQREMQQDTPSFDFLISVNENIAAALSSLP